MVLSKPISSESIAVYNPKHIKPLLQKLPPKPNATYTIEYQNSSAPANRFNPFEIKTKHLSPENTDICKSALKALELIADFTMQKAFERNLQNFHEVSICEGAIIKLHKNVESCSNSKILEIINEKNITFCTKNEAKKHGLLPLLMPTDFQKFIIKTVKEKKPQDRAYDPIASVLNNPKFIRAVTIELIIKKIEKKQPDTICTSLRYPHLLENLYFDNSLNRKSKDMQILIVGPGMLENLDEPSMCPQLSEMLMIFPNAKYKILDNNAKVLNLIHSQTKEERKVTIDPATLEDFFEKANEKKDQKSIELFKYLKSISLETEHPDLPAEILDYKKLKVNPENIDIQYFDIISDEFTSENTFDIIIATNSIKDAILKEKENNPQLNVFSIIAKFLKTLKENSSMYIDFDLFKVFFPGPLKENQIILGFRYIEHLIGLEIKLQKISISDFLLNCDNEKNKANLQINTDSIYTLKKDLKYFITTSPMVKIRKTSTKAAFSEKEKTEILTIMEKVLKSPKKEN